MSVGESGNPGRNLLLCETVELGNLGLPAKLQRHYPHRLIATVCLDDQPAAMYASFAAPIRVRDEVRAKLLDCAKRLDSGVVLAFFVAQFDHISRHERLPLWLFLPGPGHAELTIADDLGGIDHLAVQRQGHHDVAGVAAPAAPLEGEHEAVTVLVAPQGSWTVV